MKFTEELFNQVAPTYNFTRAQMAVFGEPWPQVSGWKKRIIGTEITEEHLSALLTFRKQLCDRKEAKHGYRGKTKREHKKESVEICASLPKIQLSNLPEVILPNLSNSNVKTFLNVPYAEKDKAKSLGAKWDLKLKKWYCIGDSSKFYKWMDGSSNHQSKISIQPSLSNDLEPGTEAYRAYMKGKEYAENNLHISGCPYTTARVIALKNWFEKGFNEANETRTEIIDGRIFTIGKDYIPSTDTSTPF